MTANRPTKTGEVIPLVPSRPTPPRLPLPLAPYADPSTPDGAMLQEGFLQRLAMQLTRQKVQFAMSELTALSHAEADIYARFLEDIEELQARYRHLKRVSRLLEHYIETMLPTIEDQLTTYREAYFHESGRIAMQSVRVAPGQPSFLSRIVAAITGR